MTDKAVTCRECKWIDSDWYWDDEYDDECEVFYCSKVDRDFSSDDADWTPCGQFKKRPKPIPYKEKDTECDLCEQKAKCLENGLLLDSTISIDTRRHYIRGLCCFCPKQEVSQYV